MATIVNPTPVTTQTFNGMWVQHISVIFLTGDKPKGAILAQLLPYDGANLLALGGKRVTRPLPSAETETIQMIDSLKAEVARLSGNNSEPLDIMIFAQDPSKPVSANIRFADKKAHNIADCFALAAKDGKFASVLGSTLAEIARIAGLSVDA